MAPQPIRAVAALAALASTEALLASRGQDACACLNWQQVYRSKQAECGKALELYQISKQGLQAENKYEEFCNKFYLHVNTSMCLNVDFTHKPTDWDVAQWCYVSPQCQELNGGRKVPDSQLSWKLCSSRDESTKNLHPLQLDWLRGHQNLDLGLLAKFSYPIWQAQRWPAVEKLFMRPGPLSELPKYLQQIVDSKQPVVFDSKDGDPPFHIVAGQQIYRIDRQPEGIKNWILGRMSEVNGIKCVKGCEQ
mmetsp:Transcript_88164/g.267368  ORF Transcript_88164/g.267368 Transcript_88164/m.267368 type:complete len:249 (-) Transcript_88164:68-814(-)